jgi:hypothetical protein
LSFFQKSNFQFLIITITFVLYRHYKSKHKEITEEDLEYLKESIAEKQATDSGVFVDPGKKNKCVLLFK